MTTPFITPEMLVAGIEALNTDDLVKRDGRLGSDMARVIHIYLAMHNASTPTEVASYEPDGSDAPIRGEVASEAIEQIISAWAFAHDIDGAARNDLLARLRASRVEKPSETDVAEAMKACRYYDNDGTDKITEDAECEINFNALARTAISAMQPRKPSEAEHLSPFADNTVDQGQSEADVAALIAKEVRLAMQDEMLSEPSLRVPKRVKRAEEAATSIITAMQRSG